MSGHRPADAPPERLFVLVVAAAILGFTGLVGFSEAVDNGHGFVSWYGLAMIIFALVLVIAFTIAANLAPRFRRPPGGPRP